MGRKFIGCFILLLVVFAVTDKRNGVPAGFVPLVVFLTILGVGTSFGMQTGTFFCYLSSHPF
jgi:aquaglyceroporin related protein